MKFRAKLVDITAIQHFSQLLHTLSRYSNRFVLRINEEKLIFVLSDKNVKGLAPGTSAWCEVPNTGFFSDYGMEGVSKEYNEIYLEAAFDVMASCVSTLKACDEVTCLKLKLTNKLEPCLTFEIDLPSANSNAVVVHDIPVQIVPRRFWTDFQEPEAPNLNISIEMPELKSIRQCLDRLKLLGPRITISASKSGRLSFSVETYSITSTVKFKNLKVYEIDENNKNDEEEMDDNSSTLDHIYIYSVEVDTKSLIQVLPPSEGTLKPHKFICSIVDKRLLHIFFIYGEISLQYSFPGKIN